MRTRGKGIPFLIPFALVALLAGCGDGSNDNIVIGLPTATPATGHTPTPAHTATPVPGATATETTGAPEPTPTETTEGPVPTATPVAGGCSAGAQIVVTETLDATFGGATTDLKYPASVNIPGTGSTSDVSGRVHFAVSGGLTSVNDHPSNGGASDDTLSLSFASSADNPAGALATITFDCFTGQAPPTASDFTCTVTGASDSTGTPISGVNCSLTVTGP